MQGAGCRVQGAGCRVQGAGCRVQGAGCGVPGSRVQGARCTVQGAGCRVQDAGCRMQGAGFKGAGCGDLDRKASPSCWKGSPNPNRARIARGETNHLTTGVTFPLQGAEAQNPHFSSLKRGRDPGIQTICLSPRYPGKDPQVKSKQRGMGRQRLVEQNLRHMQANKLSKSLAYT